MCIVLRGIVLCCVLCCVVLCCVVWYCVVLRFGLICYVLVCFVVLYYGVLACVVGNTVWYSLYWRRVARRVAEWRIVGEGRLSVSPTALMRDYHSHQSAA